MKIGIDCRKILNPEAGEVGGVAHYTYWLVQHLINFPSAHEFVLYFDYRMRDIAPFERANVTIRFFPYSQYKRYLPFAYSHLLASAYISSDNLDVFHSTTASTPLAYTKSSVVTVHDLAIYHHPEWFPSHFLSRQSFSKKVLVPSTLRRASHIIAVSHFTKRDIIELFHIKPERISVIHEAVVSEDVSPEQVAKTKKQFGLERPYVLFLGTIEPRKNISTIVEVFTDLMLKQKQTGPFDLVIAGGRGWNNESVFRTVSHSIARLQGSHCTIHMIGAVSHEHKMGLLKGATLFVWPTFYEGFGLPVLEAMSVGVPVISSSSTAIPEVVNGSALLIDPMQSEQIYAAMESLLLHPDRRERLSEAGLQRVKEFSWQKTAEETLKVYERVGHERQSELGESAAS